MALSISAAIGAAQSNHTTSARLKWGDAGSSKSPGDDRGKRERAQHLHPSWIASC